MDLKQNLSRVISILVPIIIIILLVLTIYYGVNYSKIQSQLNVTPNSTIESTTSPVNTTQQITNLPSFTTTIQPSSTTTISPTTTNPPSTTTIPPVTTIPPSTTPTTIFGPFSVDTLQNWWNQAGCTTQILPPPDPTTTYWNNLSSTTVQADMKQYAALQDSVHKNICTGSGFICQTPLTGIRLPGAGWQLGDSNDQISVYGNTVGSVQDCQTQCSKDPTCKQWVFNGTNCYGMNKKYPYDPTKNQDSLFTSGYCRN